jgi:acetyl-CoA synthetase
MTLETTEKTYAWFPTEEHIKNANITTFLKKHHLTDYKDLYTRSLQDSTWFYESILAELDIRWKEPYSNLVNHSKGNQWVLVQKRFDGDIESTRPVQ